jgi:CheY-like chemotaxis protein
MKPTILIVEDDDVQRYLLAFFLKEKGYSVVEATDGARGRELARQAPPDLIVVDLHLPDQDGLALVKELQQNPRLSHVPIVAVTASTQPEDWLRIRNSGCVDHWEKPIDFSRLLDRIAIVISRQ